MSNRSNDIGSVIRATLSDYLAQGRKNEGRFGNVIAQVKEAIEVRLAGLIAPTSEWIADDKRILDVGNAVLAVCGYSKEDMPEKDSKAYVNWLADKKEQSKEIQRAVRTLAAIYALNYEAEKRFEANPVEGLERPILADYIAGQWRFPLQWFVPSDHSVVTSAKSYPDGRGGFTFKNAGHAVHCDVEDAKAKTLNITISPEKLMTLASVATKRSARPGASTTAKPQGDVGENTAQQTVPLDTARNAVALAAGIDDFKYKPSKIEAESWETMFDTMATNPYFRAMMLRAISRANKADGDAASEANKRTA